MRGVIMAGGSGSRLHPLTKSVNKHLLPVFDKPLIYYPLTTLMLAGIREFALVTSPGEVEKFTQLLGDGSQFGIEIRYVEQPQPSGIAQGLTLTRNFILGAKVGFILGDNLFHGLGLGRQLAQHQNVTGAQIFTYQVSNPESYGVVELGADGEIVDLHEKPKNPPSNLAITGLYFYDEEVSDLAASLMPSARGELEITDLNRLYLNKSSLKMTVLSKGTAWLDTGTFTGLHDASSYIRIVEERQNSKIGDPLEAAQNQGWI
jgi:glucose-1-phosphate thymidylyltransferase